MLLESINKIKISLISIKTSLKIKINANIQLWNFDYNNLLNKHDLEKATLSGDFRKKDEKCVGTPAQLK